MRVDGEPIARRGATFGPIVAGMARSCPVSTWEVG
jgi:hypothetical protein